MRIGKNLVCLCAYAKCGKCVSERSFSMTSAPVFGPEEVISRRVVSTALPRLDPPVESDKAGETALAGERVGA
jgi:hypothetical protein